MKDKTHSKQSGLSDSEKKTVDSERKGASIERHSIKDKRHIILFNKFVFVNEPPPKYQETKT